MVMRLSRIMRGRLRNQEHFAPLRDELAFIEDYLSIELVRFGDKLRVVKHIDPATLDMLVPSMLLQPLIENSIKHGISSKVDGGTVTIRTAHNNGRLSIEVEDDGVGIPEAELAGILNKGIGVSNVKERLKVLYNQDYRMLIDSQPGRGTRIEIEVPGDADPAGGGFLMAPFSEFDAHCARSRRAVGAEWISAGCRARRAGSTIWSPAFIRCRHCCSMKRRTRSRCRWRASATGCGCSKSPPAPAKCSGVWCGSTRAGLTCGFDLSPNMAARTQRLARRHLPDAKAHCQAVDACNMPFRDGAFDAVVCCYLLELMGAEDILRALGEIHRVLRPNGRLALVLIGQNVPAFNAALQSSRRTGTRILGPAGRDGDSGSDRRL